MILTCFEYLFLSCFRQMNLYYILTKLYYLIKLTLMYNRTITITFPRIWAKIAALNPSLNLILKKVKNNEVGINCIKSANRVTAIW